MYTLLTYDLCSYLIGAFCLITAFCVEPQSAACTHGMFMPSLDGFTYLSSSLREIFQELDTENSGELNTEEIEQGSFSDCFCLLKQIVFLIFWSYSTFARKRIK